MDGFEAHFDFSINYLNQQDHYGLLGWQRGFSHSSYWNQEELICGNLDYVPITHQDKYYQESSRLSDQGQ